MNDSSVKRGDIAVVISVLKFFRKMVNSGGYEFHEETGMIVKLEKC